MTALTIFEATIYLKTCCYVGDGGRDKIRDVLHPLIDTELWKKIKCKFKNDKEITNCTHCWEPELNATKKFMISFSFFYHSFTNPNLNPRDVE